MTDEPTTVKAIATQARNRVVIRPLTPKELAERAESAHRTMLADRERGLRLSNADRIASAAPARDLAAPLQPPREMTLQDARDFSYRVTGRLPPAE
jgi:hypothetical protein